MKLNQIKLQNGTFKKGLIELFEIRSKDLALQHIILAATQDLEIGSRKDYLKLKIGKAY